MSRLCDGLIKAIMPNANNFEMNSELKQENEE
jgi:hypothetical protein